MRLQWCSSSTGVQALLWARYYIWTGHVLNMNWTCFLIFDTCWLLNMSKVERDQRDRESLVTNYIIYRSRIWSREIIKQFAVTKEFSSTAVKQTRIKDILHNGYRVVGVMDRTLISDNTISLCTIISCDYKPGSSPLHLNQYAIITATFLYECGLSVY